MKYKKSKEKRLYGMNEHKKVRIAINALYKSAAINYTFDGEINEQVAKVFGQMLIDIRKCSAAYTWVPRPTGTVVSIGWIAKNFTQSVIHKLQSSQSFTCARARILQYKSHLMIASVG